MRAALLLSFVAACEAGSGTPDAAPVDAPPVELPLLEQGHGAWAPNGEVTATAYADGVLYVGGNFTEVGPITGSFAPVDLRGRRVHRHERR